MVEIAGILLHNYGFNFLHIINRANGLYLNLEDFVYFRFVIWINLLF